MFSDSLEGEGAYDLKKETKFLDIHSDTHLVDPTVDAVRVNFLMPGRWGGSAQLSTASNYQLTSTVTISSTYIISNHLSNHAEKDY